jgi:hypothetical protein
MGTVDVCPGCGMPGGGRQACQDVFHDVSLRVRALAWTDSLKSWRLMHDVYALQHPEELCPSRRELVTHLGGVAWALEFDGSERGYRALQQLATQPALDGEPYPPPPGFPADRGRIHVKSLEGFAEPQLLVAGIDRWARATWLAYAPLQALARGWAQHVAAQAPKS